MSVTFTLGGTSITIASPGKRSGTVKVAQPTEYSSGWARVGYAPRAVLHTMGFSYTSMPSADKASLESYFSTVDGAAKQWTYTDMDANTVPVWFENPALSFEERMNGIFNSDFSLLSLQTFFPLTGGTPTLSDADTILTRLYYSYHLDRNRKQPRVLMSDGTVRNYDKSIPVRLTHGIYMPCRTRDEMAQLISLFASAAAGSMNTFTWHLDGAAKTVRFAGSGLSWTQEPRYDETYDVTGSLEEDI